MAGKTAREECFDSEEFKTKMSVEQFFKRKYNITLRHHSDLPLINVSADDNRPVYLPAEICDIVPGQAYRSKLNAEQTAAMTKVACNQPASNGKAITNEGFKSLGLRPPGAALGPFGISVSPNMQVVPYRVLPPPTISYSGNTPQLRVQDAGWNMMNAKFHTGADMTDWAVLLINENQRNEFQFRGSEDPQLRTFLETFASKCTASGIKGAGKRPRIWTADLPPIRRDTPIRSGAIAEIGKKLEEGLKQDPTRKPSFILVLLPGIDKFVYPGIKQLADVRLGVHTVHMLLPKARGTRANIQDQYFSSVALKVNAKLGGVNHRLDAGSMRWLTGTGQKGTMVMGIDVTHPGTGSLPGTPSLAAVVASVDSEFVQFPASFALQKPDWNKDSKEVRFD
uniref:N/A n=1 Tax=Ganoderma boninense TaxID=34458 RepID=A0A5K1JZW1_9APHY|nr:N/A [Ganoderma boninense]